MQVNDPVAELVQLKLEKKAGEAIGESLIMPGTPESTEIDEIDVSDVSDAQNIE